MGTPYRDFQFGGRKSSVGAQACPTDLKKKIEPIASESGSEAFCDSFEVLVAVRQILSKRMCMVLVPQCLLFTKLNWKKCFMGGNLPPPSIYIDRTLQAYSLLDLPTVCSIMNYYFLLHTQQSCRIDNTETA